MSTSTPMDTDTPIPIAPVEKVKDESGGAVNPDRRNDLKVLSQYVQEPPPPSSSQDTASYAGANTDTDTATATNSNVKKENNNRTSSSSNTRNNNNNNNKKKKQKRPRDAVRNLDDRICRPVICYGEECPYGEGKCRFNHDLKSILNSRPDDIQEVEGGCPRYNLYGFCEFGVTCRVGTGHLNMSTGKNLRKSETEMASITPPPPIQNELSKELQLMLRKRKYKFQCKRFNEGKNNRRKGGGSSGGSSGGDKNKEDGSTGEGATTKDNNTPGEEITTKTEERDLQQKNAAIMGKQDRIQEQSPEKKDMDMKTPLPALKTRKLIDFSKKVYIAPLTTVGNLPFRRIMKQYQADITCGEMALVKNLLEGKPSEWALLKRHPSEDIFGIQLAAGHADMFTRVSEVIENESLNVDFIDMNLGCPIDLICHHGAGAKMMMKQNKLKESLMGMSKVLSIPITVKMRTGWDETKPFAHKLISSIQSWGIDPQVATIMVHGRSRLQRYSKLANWDYIEKSALDQSTEIPKIPIVGNGDIFTYTDYEEKILAHKELSPTAMLGRGALIKPWLPTEIKERRHWDISASERLDMLKDFVRFGLEHWGSDQQGVNTTRRFLLEWLSFLYRYIPVGMLEANSMQQMSQRPPNHLVGRNDLETLMLSKSCTDWIKISEMLLGPVPDGFRFEPKHKANSYK